MTFAGIWLTYLLIGVLVVSFREGLTPIDEAVSKVVIWPAYLYMTRKPKQRIRSGKNSINIQTDGDLDIHEDFDGNINIQTRGRVLRKKKKVEVKELSEADLLKKNPLE